MPALEVRSYRAVFELERRLYRVDAFRLPPAGVPLRGLLYCGALLAISGVAVRLPVLGSALAVLPWYVRHLALPGLVAGLLCILRIEGRPFHTALGAMLALACGSRRLSGWRPAPRSETRWQPPPLLLLPDGSDGRLRRLRYRGPGVVLARVSHRRFERAAPAFGLGRRAQVELHRHGVGRPLRSGVAVELAPGAVLETRSDDARRATGPQRPRNN